MESGSSLGPYQILDRLGAGGMGEVYLARDSRLGRKAALKVVGDRFKSDETARRDLLREARMASNLNHPNICTIYDVGEDDGQTYIGMEYLEGRPLSEVIDEGPLDSKTVIDYTGQLVDALAYAHDKGVMHRDLKSLNAMVTPEGRVKVLDFGLARPLAGGELEETKSALTTLSEIGPVAGTVPYMAPELLRGERADVRSDIWALGVMLYEMAAGQRPFQGNTGFEVCAAILNQQVPAIPKSIPSGLAAIISKCLVKEPEQRYQTAGEIRADLESALAQPVQTGARAGRPRILQYASVVILVVAVSYGVWQLVRPDPDEPTGPQSDLLGAAIFPFTVRGSSQLVDVGEGMMDLLAVNLDGVGDLRAADTNRLMSTLRREAQGADLDPVLAQRVARRLDAQLYMLGTVVIAGGHLQAQATLYNTLDGEAQQSVSARVDGEEKILALADELATQILVDRLPQGEEYAGLSVSFEALKPYLEGEKLTRAGDFIQATESFQAAVEVDSLFALAWMRMYNAAGAWNGDIALQALQRAGALRERLSRRDQLLLDAIDSMFRGAWVESEERCEALLDIYPNDGDAWFLRGDILLHSAPLRGISVTPAREHFERAIEYGAAEPFVIGHQSWQAIADGRTADFVALIERQLEIAPEQDYTPVAKTWHAFVRGTPAEQDAALRGLKGTEPRDLWTSLTAYNLASNSADYPAAARVLQTLLEVGVGASVRALAHMSLAHLELAQGRWIAAREHVAEAETIDRVIALEFEFSLLTHPIYEAKRDDLGALRSKLLDLDPSQVDNPGAFSVFPFLLPYTGQGAQLRLYLLGLTSAMLGDVDDAASFADSLEHLAAADSTHGWWIGFSRALRGHFAYQQGQAVEALAALSDSTLEVPWAATLFSPVFAQDYDRFVRAQLHEELGQDEEALRWYRTMGWQDLFGTIYVAPAHLAQARIYERRGDTQQAVEHYSRFIDLWASCDPEIRPVVQEARTRRDALTRQIER